MLFNAQSKFPLNYNNFFLFIFFLYLVSYFKGNHFVFLVYVYFGTSKSCKYVTLVKLNK